MMVKAIVHPLSSETLDSMPSSWGLPKICEAFASARGDAKLPFWLAAIALDSLNMRLLIT